MAQFEFDSVFAPVVILLSLLPCCLEKCDFKVPVDISAFSFIVLFVVHRKMLLNSKRCSHLVFCYVALCGVCGSVSHLQITAV